MMVGLDGFEQSVAERLLAEARLPMLARIRAEGAETQLDHGAARRTGLAWEHVSTGLSPAAARRWAAVDFDPSTYGVAQRPTGLAPFPARLDRRTVVFDPPYFDLSLAPSLEGLTGWGAHDPGVDAGARPAGLAEEVRRRFGPYPAERFIYGFVWPSETRTREMGDALARAAKVRADIAEWLFGERLPEWDLGYLVVSEYHSALEALWHGVDPDHPLHHLPSAAPARAGVEAVYEEVDRLMGRLIARFPDCDFLFFNLHGMGPNNSDVPSMVLLSELLFRASFGRPAMKRGNWPEAAGGPPQLGEDSSWSAEILGLLPHRRRAAIRRTVRRLLAGRASAGNPPLEWMPAVHYARHWPRMRAFALPSFYDGRARLNLKGRERDGLVEPADYERSCAELVELVQACKDVRTGEPVVAAIDLTEGEPLSRHPTEPDLTIVWNGSPLGFEHPVHGRIGPLPYRRTGGHTGGNGVAYGYGPHIKATTTELRDAFDVVPTAIDLVGHAPLNSVSGSSFAAQIAR
jgi:predicted AlkP superfamily phosphohydrolase/phosphomutase